MTSYALYKASYTLYKTCNTCYTLWLQGRLLPHELAWICGVQHPPVMAATVLTQLIAAAKLPQMLQVTVDQQLVQYVDSVAACERLQKQPIPVAYTR